MFFDVIILELLSHESNEFDIVKLYPITDHT